MLTREQLLTVAEDLEHLRDDWWNDPPEPVLRRGSVVLRRLLAEGVLQQAWKAVGFPKEPTIIAANLEEMLGRDNLKTVLAFAGGAHFRDLVVAGARVTEGPQLPPEPPGAPAGAAYAFGLRQFIESPSLFVNGHLVSRRELVKYFANVKGGAHLELSSRRKKEEELFNRRMAQWQKAFGVLNLDAFFYELLSIGQAIGRAPDMQKLISAIRDARA